MLKNNEYQSKKIFSLKFRLVGFLLLGLVLYSSGDVQVHAQEVSEGVSIEYLSNVEVYGVPIAVESASFSLVVRRSLHSKIVAELNISPEDMGDFQLFEVPLSEGFDELFLPDIYFAQIGVNAAPEFLLVFPP